MIIKILPVKTRLRLGNLTRYIANDDKVAKDFRSHALYYNLPPGDLKSVQHAIENNYDAYANKNRQKNIAMHVIVSISPLDRPKMTEQRMKTILQTFIEKAYYDAYSFSMVHHDKEHWHGHCLISGNKIMDKKSVRLSKAKLFEVQKDMIQFIREQFNLENTIDMKEWGKKRSNEKTYHMQKRNPDLLLDKDKLKNEVQDIFRTCESSAHFYNELEKQGYRLYDYQGHRQGIIYGDSDRKMRFSRLGIDKSQLDILDRQHERLQELEKTDGIDIDVTRDRYLIELDDRKEESVPLVSYLPELELDSITYDGETYEFYREVTNEPDRENDMITDNY